MWLCVRVPEAAGRTRRWWLLVFFVVVVRGGKDAPELSWIRGPISSSWLAGGGRLKVVAVLNK